MGKLDELKQMYVEILSKGIITSKQELAERLGVNRSSLYSAFNGDERYLTDSLLRKIRKLISDESRINNVSDTNQESALMTIIAQKDKRIEELVAELTRTKMELEQIKKGDGIVSGMYNQARQNF